MTVEFLGETFTKEALRLARADGVPRFVRRLMRAVPLAGFVVSGIALVSGVVGAHQYGWAASWQLCRGVFRSLYRGPAPSTSPIPSGWLEVMMPLGAFISTLVALAFALALFEAPVSGSFNLRLRAYGRTAAYLWVTMFAAGVVLWLPTHGLLLSLSPKYRALALAIVRGDMQTVMSFPLLLFGLFCLTRYFGRSSLLHVRSFGPSTYGQLNLNAGSFGGETWEGRRRVKRFIVASHRRIFGSLALTDYAVAGKDHGFPRLLRCSRLLGSFWRAWSHLGAGVLSANRREQLRWRGLSGLKARLAAGIGTRPEAVFPTTSTTNAIRLFLDAVGAEVDGQIFVSSQEHPSVVHLLRTRFGTARVVEFGPSGHEWTPSDWSLAVKAVPSADAGRSLWLFSEVDFRFGLRLPVRELTKTIRESHRATIILDGAHGPGNIEVNFSQSGADAYAFCGHKWLMGRPGSGFLVVADAYMNNVAAVHREGPIAGSSDIEDGRAALAIEPFLSCDAFVGFLQLVGWRNVAAHQLENRNLLAQVAGTIDELAILASEDKQRVSAIATFRVRAPRSAPEVAAALSARHISVGVVPSQGAIRFSVPYHLDEFDIHAVCAVLKSVLGRQRK